MTHTGHSREKHAVTREWWQKNSDGWWQILLLRQCRRFSRLPPVPQSINGREKKKLLHRQHHHFLGQYSTCYPCIQKLFSGLSLRVRWWYLKLLIDGETHDFERNTLRMLQHTMQCMALVPSLHRTALCSRSGRSSRHLIAIMNFPRSGIRVMTSSTARTLQHPRQFILTASENGKFVKLLIWIKNFGKILILLLSAPIRMDASVSSLPVNMRKLELKFLARRIMKRFRGRCTRHVPFGKTMFLFVLGLPIKLKRLVFSMP